jgi:hypothetical protein
MTMPDQQLPEREFNLQPHPRILPMLGEINLAQWQCIAELVDNSLDAFIDAARAGIPLPEPMITSSSHRVPTATRG